MPDFAIFPHVSVFRFFSRLAGGHSCTPAQAAAAVAVVLLFTALCSTQARASDPASLALARERISAFQATFDPDFPRLNGLNQEQVLNLRKVRAFEISSDYAARRLLKTSEFAEGIGKEYFKMWFDEGDGLIHAIIARAKGRMGGYSQEVLDLITVIQNEKSKLTMKAPMDFDVGILSKTPKEAVKNLKKLGGPGAVGKFHQDLQAALEAAYMDLFASLGGTEPVNPVRAFLSATTGWHPEAYADVKVLKEGGVAGKDLVQQTADVSKYKISEMRKHAEHGILTIEEAMQEAARGTAKDLDKVERVFGHLEKITGVKSKWSAEQLEIISVLKRVEAMEMTAETANKEILRISGGRMDLFGACDQLIDQMEAAWRLRQVKPQELLLSILADHLDDADYDKAMKASVAGKLDELPPSARKIVGELETTAKMRLVSMRNMPPHEFLTVIANEFPNFKIMANTGDPALHRFLSLIETQAGAASDDIVAIFGREAAERYRRINELLTPAVKQKITIRYGHNKFALWELDQNGRVLLGDAGSTLKIDAAIGLAMGFWQTASIMDQGLSPDEETRALLNAWGTALPVVGDIAQGLIEGAEGWYGEDNSKLFKAGVWITIGAAQLVPGAQAPGLVAGLALMTYEVTSSVWDVSSDKALIEAWIASGDWEDRTGRLKAILDASGTGHELSPVGLFDGGDTGYKSGLPGVTIRDSLYQYAERSGLYRNEKLETYILALKQAHPDFPFTETLREPLRTAKPLFGAAIREGGVKEPMRSVDMLLFTKAKQIVDSETARAVQHLVGHVEAEYQARRHMGEALETFRQLEELGGRLNLPLLQRVQEIFKSFGSFVSQSIKTPWVRESLPRRQTMLAERYLAGYLEIEASLKRIERIFTQAGIRPPKHNLSGYLEIDAPRMKDLESAYATQAIGVPGRDVQRIHRAISGDASYVFSPASPHPCDAGLFKTLSGIMVRVVDAEDRRLLLEQWSGRRSAAETSRDEKLRIAQRATEDMKKSVEITIPGYGQWNSTVGALPGRLWDGLADGFEEAYAWSNVNWEGSEIYLEQSQAIAARIERLKAEYTQALEAGERAMADCLRQSLQCTVTVVDAAPVKGVPVKAHAVTRPSAPPASARWEWVGEGGVRVVSGDGDTALLTADGPGSLKLRVLDAKGVVMCECGVSVAPQKDDGNGSESGAAASTPDRNNITVTAPAIWPGVVNETGVHLKRQEAKGGATYEMCPYPASVWGEVSGKMSPSFAPRSVDEIRAKFEQDKLTNEKWGRTVEIRPFSIDDYHGHMLESTMRYLRGGWSGDGYRDSGVEAFGHAFVTKGGRTIEFTYSVGSGGCWDNSQRAFQESQAAAARAEAQAILAGIRLSETPALVQVPYTGPKLDGSDLPVVRLRPEKIPVLKIGEVFTIEAVVENAKSEDSPFSYEWSGTHGNADDLKSAVATIMPDAAGKFSVAVAVGGARHHLGSAALEYTVADYKVHIERVPADAGPVSVGTKVGFAARLTVDGQPAQGDFIYRWQPHPEASFDRLDAAESDVRAVFHAPGRTGVWVQVLERREGREITVAESAQLEIEVVAPKLSLVIEPAEPFVGQDVKALLAVEPEMKELDLRWVPLPFNAKQGARSADGRELSFYMRDDKPMALTVMARVPVSGESLGLAQGGVTAKKYAVTVLGPKAMGPPPRVWKEGVGLVEVTGAIAVDQIVEFTAETQPAALSGPVRYQWKVASGQCSISNPASREARVTAGQAGTCELLVVVRDRNDVELGSAAASFTASVTREAVQQGSKKALGQNGGVVPTFESGSKPDVPAQVPVDGIDASAAGQGVRGSGTGSALVGVWDLNANSYSGKIEFQQDGGRITGRLWLSGYAGWEELQAVAFDGVNLTFTRPIPGLDQRYTGVMSAGEVHGTFDQAGSGSYVWWMKRGPM